jgi:hypothetical protein
VSAALAALDRRGRACLSEALRVGAPMDLALDGGLPADLLPAEIGPLVRHASAADPSVQAALRRWAAPAGRDAPGPAVTAVLPASRGRPLGVGALRGQDLPVRVLVLSNGAEGPERVAGAEVHRVAWAGHGATRQAALQHVRTPYTLFTVDDAVLLGAGCLRRLVDALESGGWDAVVARQVPWPDSDPVTRGRLRSWTPAADAPVEMPQVDHVCALYRTEILRSHPLPPAPIAEDLGWSAGRRVGLVPGAPVLHAHRRRAGALFARECAIHRERRRLGLPPSVPHLPGAMLRSLGALPLGPREVVRHVAEVAGQWWGARG